MESRQRDQSISDVEQAEDGGGGVSHDLLHRAQEGAVDQQAEGENAKDCGRTVGPLEVDAKQQAKGNDDCNARGAGATALRKAHKLPCGQRRNRHDGRGEEPMPPRSKKHQEQDDRDQDGGSDDALHSGLRIHRPGSATRNAGASFPETQVMGRFKAFRVKESR